MNWACEVLGTGQRYERPFPSKAREKGLGLMRQGLPVVIVRREGTVWLIDQHETDKLQKFKGYQRRRTFEDYQLALLELKQASQYMSSRKDYSPDEMKQYTQLMATVFYLLEIEEVEWKQALARAEKEYE